MNKRFAFSLLIVISVLASAAQAVDKDKLRAAVELPHVAMTGGLGVNDLGDFVFAGEQVDHAAEIVRLHQTMQGNPSDAERWQRLASLYSAQGENAKADEAGHRAIALYRKRLKAHPHDGLTLAHLGATLPVDEQAAEAERVLRQAVQDAPRQWECWTELGSFLDGRAWNLLLEGKATKKHDLAQALTAVMARHPAPEKIAQIRKLLDEARPCFDKSIALANDQADVYFRRAGFWMVNGFLRAVLDLLDGKPVNPFAGFMNPNAAADFRQVVRLRPDDFKARGTAALFTLASAALRADHPIQKKEDMLKLLSPQNRKAVRADVKRLEELARSTDQAVAVGSMETLGVLYLLGLGDMSRATAMYQKLVALQPHNERAWEALLACLVAEEKVEELVAASERHVKITDSAHNRFLLAKAYAWQKRWDKVDEQLEAARKLDPKDYMAALAWAAVRTRASHDPASLDAARAAVAKAHELLPPNASLQQRTDGQAIAAICWALAGDTAGAHKRLEEVLQADPSQKMAKHALEALEAEPGNKP